MKSEPFLFRDTFGFTIYRDSLDKAIIYNIYEYYKKELNIDFNFHKKETQENLNKIKKKLK